MNINITPILNASAGIINKPVDWVAAQKKASGVVGKGSAPGAWNVATQPYPYTRLLSVEWKAPNLLVFTFDDQPADLGNLQIRASLPGSTTDPAIEVTLGGNQNTVEASFDNYIDNPTTWTALNIDTVTFVAGKPWIDPTNGQSTGVTHAVESIIAMSPHNYLVTLTSEYGDTPSTNFIMINGTEADTITPVDSTSFTWTSNSVEGEQYWQISTYHIFADGRPIGPPYEGYATLDSSYAGSGSGSDSVAILPLLKDTIYNDYSSRILAAVGTGGSEGGSDASVWFSPFVFNPQTVTLNSGCWAAGLDTTPIVAINSNWVYYAKMGGCAITKRHLATAMHFNLGAGATFYFRLPNGNLISRTSVRFGMKTSQGIRIGTNPYAYLAERVTDICICELDSDLPDEITVAKLLPANWTNYVGNNGQGLPCILESKRPISDPSYIFTKYLFGGRVYSNGSSLILYSSYLSPPNDDITYVDGDWQNECSGMPAITHINGQVVFLTTAQGVNSGPNYSYYQSDVQEILNALGGGYSLSFVDLSGFRVVV